MTDEKPKLDYAPPPGDATRDESLLSKLFDILMVLAAIFFLVLGASAILDTFR